MNAIIAEENYDMVRWLYQIKRVKSRRLGFIKNHFIHILYSPLLRSNKLTRSDEDIKRAVDFWCDDATRAEAEATYGRIGDWETSNVTTMSGLFFGKSTFNDDISAWNVSNVTNMSCMFYGARSFHSDISVWNVTNVINMYGMFQFASAFHSDISAWNVSSVTNMSYMFLAAIALYGDLSEWAVSDATRIEYMFDNCPLANNMKPARCRN